MTIDEFVHLPVGLYMLRHLDFHLDPVHGTLGRLIPALALLPGGIQFDPPQGVSHFAMGFRFMAEHATDYPAQFLAPRIVMILESLLIGGLVLLWATRLYGETAGLVALALFAFSPSLLAHGHLVTTDVPGALGLLAVSYSGWRFVENPVMARAAIFGAALGIGPALKLTVLPSEAAIFAFVCVAAHRLRAAEAAPWRAPITLLCFAFAVALFFLNLSYGFQGTLAKIGDLAFEPAGRLHRCSVAAPWLRTPLPGAFLSGLDSPTARSQVPDPESYLASRWSKEGWRYYHLAAYGLKTPLPVLLWSILAVALWVGGRSPGVGPALPLFSAITVFVSNAVLNPVDIGVRHVLAAEPFLLIAAARWISLSLQGLAWRGRTPSLGRRLAGRLAAISLVWYALSSLAVAPRYLEYFNEAAGGPSRSYRWLVDSNLDWGQDLVRLADYMRSHRLSSIRLAYFGSVNPIVYGVRFTSLHDPGGGRLAVISPTLLMGRSYFIWETPARVVWSPFDAYAELRKQHAIDRIGSLFVFELP